MFPSLTVARKSFGRAARPALWERRTGLCTCFQGWPRRATSMGWQLSGGEQQMLSIGRALMGNPKVLLMDEPMEGLAPVIVEQLVEVLSKLVADGTLAVLLVEQRVDVVLNLASRCLIMDRGRVVHEESSGTLLDNPERLAQLIGLE